MLHDVYYLMILNVPWSVVDEFNTQDDVDHVTSHTASPQVYGVAGLQLLVQSPPLCGAHIVPAARAVEGVVSCLQPDSVLADVDPGLLTGVSDGPITECYQVNPGTGGRKLSWNKGYIRYEKCLISLVRLFSVHV